MGKHSAHGGGPFGQKRSAGSAARHERSGMRTLGTPTVSTPSSERLRVPKDGSGRPDALEKAPARLRAERERRHHRWRQFAVVAGIIVLVLCVAGVAGAALWARGLQSKMVVREEKVVASLAKAKPQEPYTVLILGGDKRKSESYRTDTMILTRIDPKTKRIWMLSIPRDTRVVIDGHGSAKINAAFTYGGPEGAISAVKKLTGVKINHYMEVDFRGFEKAVNALGGVWIDVPVAISDPQAASHNKKASQIDAGYQLLDGAHALTFVRARHQFKDQDFSRMKNQQLFFKALADQVAKTQNIAKLPGVVSSVAPYVHTDMSLIDMIKTAQAMSSAGSKNVSTATLTGEWRSPFIWTDEANKEKLIDRMEAGVSFEGTSTPKASKSGAKSSSTQTPAKKPSQIKLTVRNGGGVSGCAKQCSSILKARGFQVVEVGNANQFVYEKTLVVYKTDAAAAELVASALPPGAKLVQSRGMYSFDSDVLVVIGKDWDLEKVPVTTVND